MREAWQSAGEADAQTKLPLLGPQTCAALAAFQKMIDTALATMRGARRLTDGELIGCFNQLHTATEICGRVRRIRSRGLRHALTPQQCCRSSCSVRLVYGFGRKQSTAATGNTQTFVTSTDCYFDTHLARAARAGAFDAIVEAARSHPCESCVLRYSCHALTCLMSDTSCRRDAFDAGALQAGLSALHMGDISSDGATQVEVLTPGCLHSDAMSAQASP